MFVSDELKEKLKGKTIKEIKQNSQVEMEIVFIDSTSLLIWNDYDYLTGDVITDITFLTKEERKI
jgi:hypothetical protein